MNKEIGFVFMRERVSDVIKRLFSIGEDVLRGDIQTGIAFDANYDVDLKSIGVSEEQFFDNIDLVRYFFPKFL